MKIKPVKLDLQRVIKQTIQLQKKNADLKKISVENQIPKNTFVFADENMLQTIIRNLTSNAIKFTNENGTIAFRTILNNGFVECAVSDTGIGMSPKTVENLFDTQSNAKKKGTANEKGTGLGLLLCKDFVERNGGQIKVESKENEGSTFIFTLPSK
jgi:two-component system, sensor histidine kinase and response regulator